MNSAAPMAAQPDATAWRCFHCDETFVDRDAAREHFGPTEHSDPACRINIKAFRQLEAVLHRWTDQGASDAEYAADNAWRAREGQHLVALQREEEKGYAKGLADGRAEFAASRAAPVAHPATPGEFPWATSGLPRPPVAQADALRHLAAIKLHCVTTINDPLAALRHVLRMCIDAGITESVGEGLEERAGIAAQAHGSAARATARPTS